MESDTLNGKLPSDTLFTLLEKQAKEFETFGKRMSSDIQNSYKFFINHHDISKTPELNNILVKQQVQLESQSLLIDSLRSRIEELENDAINKNREIKRLKNEFLDFKKEIKLLFGLETSLQSFDHNNLKKSNSLFEENDSDEFEFIHTDTNYSDSKNIIEGLTSSTDNIRSINNNNNNNNDNNDNYNNNIVINKSHLPSTTENIRSNERLIAENIQSNEIDNKKERLIFKNIQPKIVYGVNDVLPIPSKDQIVEKKETIVENKKTSIYGSVLFDEYFYNHSTFKNHGESSITVKSSFSNNKYDQNERRIIETIDQDKGKSSSSSSSSPAVFKGKSKDSDSKEVSTEESLSDHQVDDELEEDIKYNPSDRSFQDSNNNLNQKLRDLLLDLKSTEFGSKELNTNNDKLHDDFNYVTQISAPKQQKDNISCLPPISINPRPSISTSPSQNKSVQGSQRAPTIIERIQAEVQYTITRFQEQNTRIKQKTFNYLLNQFTLDGLIKYQETNYYNSLAKDPKRSIKLMVKTALRSELCNRDKRVTQPIEEYVKRKIIPSLPSGIRSYADYEKTSHFSKLSDEKKKRIRKIITVEPKK
ncbi:hypothetical protein RclHR1_01000027 [Rhizophagus clarus]|uniref:Uncharacterized protein n=1 Tax=Rhizophagus clarus TaxID=94130 RepID=A0A2Z6QEU1_9GLOM|nr:hypothetical protein RclHR1_01000027 [Rhizophagus clarus]GES94069.1 hypothetical protein GLOIN_2v1867639 [Rhizophagus clarus]